MEQNLKKKNATSFIVLSTIIVGCLLMYIPKIFDKVNSPVHVSEDIKRLSVVDLDKEDKKGTNSNKTESKKHSLPKKMKHILYYNSFYKVSTVCKRVRNLEWKSELNYPSVL